MAIIKAYTDLEQSKILKDILPPESADMWYQYIGASHEVSSEKPLYYPMVIRDSETDKDIPCWSLAALFDILPKYIGDYGKCLYYDMGYYYCGYMVNGVFMLTIKETKADNQVDACYEMILKLHEQNLF